jgi:hypothetical protein
MKAIEAIAAAGIAMAAAAMIAAPLASADAAGSQGGASVGSMDPSFQVAPITHGHQSAVTFAPESTWGWPAALAGRHHHRHGWKPAH